MRRGMLAGALLLTSCALVFAQPVGEPNPNPSIGVIDIGAAFGWMQPYINAAVGALLTTLATWVMWVLKTKLGLQIEGSHRDAYLTAAKNRASELIAEGFVHMQERGRIEINNAAMAEAVNTMLRVVPDAVAKFDIKKDDIEKSIMSMVPQVPETAVTPSGAVVAAPPVDTALPREVSRR